MAAVAGMRAVCAASCAEAGPQAMSYRAERLLCARTGLAQCRTLPPMVLPQRKARGLALGGEQLEGSAHNVVPFSGPSGDGTGLPPALPRADLVRQMLPWLFLAAGKPDTEGLEALATQHALSTLRALDLSRFAEGSVSGLPPHVRWVGSGPTPCPTIAAAAALARLAVRAQRAQRSGRGGPRHAVLAMHHPRHASFVAEALWLALQCHWGLPANEAVEVVNSLCGCVPAAGASSSAARELDDFTRGWTRRVTLAWPYGGAGVEVVGDLVGGWHCRVPLQYNAWRREWRLQLMGLAPGAHRFKFIVDGRWCADMHAPLEHDFWGNANNVVLVRGGTGSADPGTPPLADDLEDPVARLGSALLAFYCKLR